MKRRILKRFLIGAGISALIALALIAHPAWHLLKTWYTDRHDHRPPAAGNVDDASRLNETRVAEVWPIPAASADAEAQLAKLLERARAGHLPVAIAGARHSMGGHTIASNGIVVDMAAFNQLELESSNHILHAGSGARWHDVIAYLNRNGCSVEVMQSNDDFSLGGSLSVNCHGWQADRPPIASTVESFRLMLADGQVVNCSRTENRELFSLALGGYGLFGIILDVRLRIVPNERYTLEREVITAAAYAETLRHRLSESNDIAMVYGRLRVTRENFLQDAILNVLRRQPTNGPVVSPLHGAANPRLSRTIFRGSAGSDYGKRLRWNAEKRLAPFLSSGVAERNDLLSEPAAVFQNQSQDATDVLMESFVPPAQFEPLLAELREIVPRTGVDLLNITVRQVKRDDDTFLRYADQEMYSLVMLFDQARTPAGEAKMAGAARQIIGATLRHQGRYYLPYRLHATREQFTAAYPQAAAFFALKRKYDPAGLFQNRFFQQYGN